MTIPLKHFRDKIDLCEKGDKITRFDRVIGNKITKYASFSSMREINKQLKKSALWNRNYFLRFRFRLLKSYGSGSNF
jgi:hypothetical protein